MPFEIVRRQITVEWDKEAQLVFNKRPQAPDVSATFERNGETVDVELVVWTGQIGTNAGRHIFIVMAANENIRDNVELSNNIIDYQIQRRPLDVVIEETAEVKLSLNPNPVEKDTVIVNPDLFANRVILENLILSLVAFDNFATDENGISDDISVFGNRRPTVRIIDPEAEIEESSRFGRSDNLVRYRLYLLRIETEGMLAENYQIGTTEFFIRTDEFIPNFIRQNTSRDSRYGIILENAIVSDFARISVITPEQATVNLVILDNLGNVVFSANGVGAGFARPENRTNGDLGGQTPPLQNAIVWNLTNQSGRFVANGTYLIIVEATGISGRRYLYSSRIGVGR